jgi:hypothetical protein
VIQRCDGTGLPLKSLAELFFGDFDRDQPVEPRVSRAKNLAMPPAPSTPSMRYGPSCVPAATIESLSSSSPAACQTG